MSRKALLNGASGTVLGQKVTELQRAQSLMRGGVFIGISFGQLGGHETTSVRVAVVNPAPDAPDTYSKTPAPTKTL